MNRKEYINPLICHTCNNYRIIVYEDKLFTEKNKQLELELPFYYCEGCKEKTLINDELSIQKTAQQLLSEIQNNKRVKYSDTHKTERFKRFEIKDLKYDARDYYDIPGLYRQFDQGYLTPVFFKLDLLLYYNNHNNYRVSLGTFSRVIIYEENDYLVEHGLGINKHGNLFCWLGDLYELLKEEEKKEHLYRFLASNIESDHDIRSDYYLQEIEAEFVDSDNENRVLKLKDIFEKKVYLKTRLSLSKIKITKPPIDYKPPIINERQQIFRSYTKINSLLTETIQTAEIKKYLLTKGFKEDELNNLGGLKTLDMFLKYTVGDKYEKTMISPLFYLYELRLLDSHFSDGNFNKDYGEIINEFGFKNPEDYIGFFKLLIKKIGDMYEYINKHL